MSLFGAITGTDQIKAAAKAGKKAAKKQEATATNQLTNAQSIYGEQKGAADKVLPQQQAALTGALQGQTAQYAPYQQYGQQGMNALSGYYGNDPAQSQQMLQNFQNSPLYQSNYQNALENANQGLNRQQAAGGGYNSGATLKALQDRAASITNGLFGQYVGYGQNAIGVGAHAADQVGQAYGQYGANQANVLGDYAHNYLNAGNSAIGGANSAYGNILAAQGARGDASAAGHLGQANTMQGLWSGGANILGKAAGSAFGSGGYFGAQPQAQYQWNGAY